MEVTLSPAAAAAFDRLPLTIQGRMIRVFERLRGAKPLRGELAGCFRVRTGDYRIQFRIQGSRIVVQKLGHRDGFYED